MSDATKAPTPRRCWYQFSLRGLFLFMTLVAVLVAWQREPLARWVDRWVAHFFPPPQKLEPDDSGDAFPLVRFKTTLGEFTVRLNREKAPITVENFLQYVDEGYYVGTIFHEVRAGDVVAAGGYTADLQAKNASRPPDSQ